MGFTYVRVRISRERDGPARTVRLLVDTGAFYSVVPRGALEALGVRHRRRQSLRVADGRLIERDIGEAVVHYRGRSAHTFLVFGEPGDAALLGSYALEGLAFEVNPITKRLREMKVLPLVTVGAS